jgi:hypothetical protein
MIFMIGDSKLQVVSKGKAYLLIYELTSSIGYSPA